LEAAEAAVRATELAPQQAKGYLRRGCVCVCVFGFGFGLCAGSFGASALLKSTAATTLT
jgi:hypothetical protein